MWVFLILAAIAALACLGLFQAIRLAREVGFSCSEVGLPACFFVAVLWATLLFAALPYFGRADGGLRPSQNSDLHNWGLAICMYAEAHEGAYPPDLEILFEQGFAHLRGFGVWPGQELVYVQPRADASDDVIMAYYWPAGKRGTYLLFKDGIPDWAPLDEEGNLINPRSEEIILTAGEPQKP